MQCFSGARHETAHAARSSALLALTQATCMRPRKLHESCVPSLTCCQWLCNGTLLPSMHAAGAQEKALHPSVCACHPNTGSFSPSEAGFCSCSSDRSYEHPVKPAVYRASALFCWLCWSATVSSENRHSVLWLLAVLAGTSFYNS